MAALASRTAFPSATVRSMTREGAREMARGGPQGTHRDAQPRRSNRPASVGTERRNRAPSPRQVEGRSHYGRGEAPTPEPRGASALAKGQARDVASKVSLFTNVTPSESLPFKARSSSCSFGRRTPLQRNAVPVGPGPLQYKIPEQVTRYGKSSTPSYTMGGRHRFERDTKPAPLPGPGDYFPENSPLSCDRGPAYTLLGRYERLSNPNSSTTSVPAPNSYSLPSCIGGPAPHKPYVGSLRFNSRPKDDKNLFNRSPGPAQYDVPQPNAYKTQAPRPTILGTKKISLENGSVHTPAPTAYSVEQASSRVQLSTPRFTFGVRHSDRAHTITTKEDR